MKEFSEYSNILIYLFMFCFWAFSLFNFGQYENKPNPIVKEPKVYIFQIWFRLNKRFHENRVYKYKFSQLDVLDLSF